MAMIDDNKNNEKFYGQTPDNFMKRPNFEDVKLL